MNVEDVWPEIKKYIENGDLGTIQHMYFEFTRERDKKEEQLEYKINLEWIWKHAYLHSIVKRKADIETWLLQVYEGLPLLDRIGLKPTLNYARYLKQYLRSSWQTK